MKSRFAIVLMLTAVAVACGQVHSNLSIEKSSVGLKPGEKVTARLTMEIAPGWHIASLTQPDGGPVRTELALAEKQPFKLAGPVTGPKPHVEHSETFGINVETYEGTVVFSIPLEATASIPPGTKLTVDFSYQACSEENCMMPTTDRATAAIRATNGLGDKKSTQ